MEKTILINGGENKTQKKKLETPHSLAIIFVVMLIASMLTYIIPAGQFDRYKTPSGQTMIDPNSFQYVDKSPVNPLSILTYVYEGLGNARSLIFVLLCSGGGIGIILATGMFQGAAGSLGNRAKGKETCVIAFIITAFAILCIPINLNAFIPFAMLGVIIAASLGLDAIVGVAMIMMGGAIGFSCGAMNLANTGTAQQVAELPVFSGMAYRLLCMIPFLVATILYVVWYARRIKKDPTKSYLYGIQLEDSQADITDMPTFEKRHIPVAIVCILGFGYLVYTAIFSTLSNEISSSIFIYLGLAAGITYRMPINKICVSFVKGVKDMASTAILLGFAYVIGIILTRGNVMDTVVYNMAGLLDNIPAILQAPAMFIMHIVVNLFITSGSGQAAVTMPIFVPVADIVGMGRQTAVLAFNFGDGFCNFILPHAAATMGFVGAAGIPFGKWFKFAIKLFCIWSVIGIALLILASVIGYT